MINSEEEKIEERKLLQTEREKWLNFHKKAYKDDLDAAKLLLIKHPRWSIIANYYSMHDLAKYYLGKTHNIKIVPPDVHKKTINTLREKLKDHPDKNRIIELLESAKDKFENILKLREKAPNILLRQGRQQRSKVQYYSESEQNLQFEFSFSKTASYFFENIVKPFIKLMEHLIEPEDKKKDKKQNAA